MANDTLVRAFGVELDGGNWLYRDSGCIGGLADCELNMKTKKKHSVSESTLNKYWREAVLKEHGYRCFFCHCSEAVGPLECHHIVRRRKRLLVWDWRNGIPVHKYHVLSNGEYIWDGKLTCHQFAHTKEGERRIAARHKYYKYLCEKESLNKKDVLIERGMSENEFRLIMLAELKEKINEDLP